MTTATKTPKTHDAGTEQPVEPVIEQQAEATKPKKAKAEPRQCECGCGQLTGGGRFRPGHDMKRKSELLTLSRAGNEQATRELKERGWLTKDAAERETVKREQRIAKLNERIAKLEAERDELLQHA